MNMLSHLAPDGGASNFPFRFPLAARLALGLPSQRLLTEALLQAQRGANSTHNLRLDLPPPGDVRVRNLVHRGASRPVFKTTSVKLKRVVQCESALEHEAALLLDVSPAVQAFAEQPVRIHYQTEGGWRSHVPDFVAFVADCLTFVEIKFEKDVDAEVRERTRILERQLGALGADYCLLTERTLRQGDQVQNAQRVLRRARHAISEAQLLATLEKLRNIGRTTLATFGWSVANSQEAVGIAKLIMSGQAAIDPNGLLSDRTCVWLARDTACAGGAA